MTRRPALLALLLALTLAACQRGPVVHEYTFYAFGTLVELTIVDVDPAEAEAARAHAAKRLDRWHADWHAWRPGPLVRFNRRLAEDGLAPVPAELADLLPEARRLSVQSGGLVDPAIGALVALWGFHAAEPSAGPPPRPRDIEVLLEDAPTMEDLVLVNGLARSASPMLQLDFGGVAKGTALSYLSAELAAMEMKNFLLNAGGDLVARGDRGGRPWRVGIRDPGGPGVLASLEVLDGDAVFTSGDYERYFEWEGRRYHHIIDPRTGHPARGVRSVTVLTRDAALGDAAATALFVAGPEAWPATASAMDVEHVLLVAEDGTVHLSPAMAGRVRFEVEPAPPTRVTRP